MSDKTLFDKINDQIEAAESIGTMACAFSLDDTRVIREFIGAGWRCCQDHLLKPEHSCPICELEKVDKRIADLTEEIYECENNPDFNGHSYP